MNIAIWGMGLSGLSALKFLKTTEHNLYVINSGELGDWKYKKEILELVSERNCFREDQIPSDISLEQIILAPGIDPRKEDIATFIKNGVEVICEIELAARFCKLPVIAITGTNGKTTTVTMLVKALQAAGKKVFCGGNIGIPFSDILLSKETYELVVLELSSFQLESVKEFHAHIAIILNIAESHMERYNSFKDYERAKLNIVINQEAGDLFIAPGKYMGTETKATKSGVSKLTSIDLSSSNLMGEHHLENLFCIEKVLQAFNIPNSIEILQNLVNEFSGVPFRLQKEGEVGELLFINDGKSTNISATISAVKSCECEDLYLILGGKLRDQDVSFLKELSELKIKKIFCFGEAKKLIESELKTFFEIERFENLEMIFDEIKKNITKGTILFSPAFPSFDQYENYVKRGEHFKNLVQAMGHTS